MRVITRILVIALSLSFTSCLSMVPGVPASSNRLNPMVLSEAIPYLASDLLVQLPVRTTLGLGDLLLNNRKIQLSKVITDRLTIELARSGRGIITVLERSALDAALAESQFNISQLSISPENVVKVGSFIPANTILVGTINILDSWVDVQVRCFSTTDGSIVAASTVKILRDGEMEALVPLLY